MKVVKNDAVSGRPLVAISHDTQGSGKASSESGS